MRTERDLFLDACFCKNLQEFYRNLYNDIRFRQSMFITIKSETPYPKEWDNYSDLEKHTKLTLADIKYSHRYWSPTDKCRASGNTLTKEETTIHTSYWTPHCWHPIHKDKAIKHKKQEAVECQKIDTSCNDCKFFKRGKESKGHCLKKDVPTIAYINTSCNNHDCFTHRLD